jgi:hypothetical protein
MKPIRAGLAAVSLVWTDHNETLGSRVRQSESSPYVSRLISNVARVITCGNRASRKPLFAFHTEIVYTISVQCDNQVRVDGMNERR